MNVRVNMDQIRRKVRAAAAQRFSEIMNKIADDLRCDAHPESRAHAVITGDTSGRIEADQCCDAFREKVEATLAEAQAESRLQTQGNRDNL